MQAEWEIEYLRRVLEKTGLTPSALARRAGVASSTITRALNDPSHKFRPSTTTLGKVSIATGIPLHEDGEFTHPRPDRFVPVYDVAASAGHGAHVDSEEVICNMAFEESYLGAMTEAASDDLAIIGVKGHSIEPTLLDDDRVLVDMTKKNLSWDGLFVIRFDDALHVKRIGRSAIKGNVMVISDHPSYRDLDMPKTDLDVVGRVLWVGRKV